MTNNKIYLVARREYVENLRTKAFWIGIISVPIILALSMIVPIWLTEQKDARKYAVIDHSNWLMTEIEEQAFEPDLEKIMVQITNDLYKKENLDRYPEDVLATAEDYKKKLGTDDPEEAEKKIRDNIQALSKQKNESEAKAQQAIEKGEAPEKIDQYVLDQFDAFHKIMFAWWKTLEPEEAKKFGSGLKKSQFEPIEIKEGTTEEDLNAMLDEDKLFAYFVIGEDPIKGSDGCHYISNNLTDNDLSNWFGNIATRIVQKKRIENESIAPHIASKIRERLKFEGKKVGKSGKTEEVKAADTGRQWAPPAFVYLLWIAVFTSAQMLLTNTIEEKSNRIIEVLLSSVSPFQLMTGKIFGIGATGLTIITFWVLSFLGGIKIAPVVSGGIVSPPDFMAQIAGDPFFLASFLFYFLGGFLMYAAILVGFGSVCNSLKEAQNLMQPVFILLIVPLLAMIPITQDPNGTLAKFLSYVPFFTPFVMMNRAAGPPEVWEYVVTTLLIIGFTGFSFWAAAKVFRIGILMTGKPPKIKEIIRWIRAPIGTVPEVTDGK